MTVAFVIRQNFEGGRGYENASISTIANNSKNNSNNKINNNIHGSNITKRNINKHDVDDERYRYQPPISEKVPTYFVDVCSIMRMLTILTSYVIGERLLVLPTIMITTMAFGKNSYDNVSKRGGVIKSIINKTWHRRRHQGQQ